MLMVQSQRYTIVDELPGGVEVRQYPAHTLISVDVSSDFGTAGNRGFGPLVRYISGGNAAGQNIAMTSPVTHAPQSDALHTISFVLPEGMAPDDAPIPVDGAVRIVDKPESVVAALRFRGVWQEHVAVAKAQDLLNALSRAGKSVRGEVFYARYDPPVTPGFLRRNEALVELS